MSVILREGKEKEGGRERERERVERERERERERYKLPTVDYSRNGERQHGTYMHHLFGRIKHHCPVF